MEYDSGSLGVIVVELMLLFGSRMVLAMILLWSLFQLHQQMSRMSLLVVVQVQVPQNQKSLKYQAH